MRYEKKFLLPSAGIILIFLSFSLIFFLLPDLALGTKINTSGKAVIYLFRGEGCPHCDREKAFLKELKKKYSGLEVRDYEVWHNKENALLFEKILKAADIKSSGVPATLIDKKIFFGFTKETAEKIEDALKHCLENECADVINQAYAQNLKEDQKIVTLPLLGKIDSSKISLPVFTVIIGGLDSFNPCAFFVLLFLLSLLIHARSRKRMFLIGGIFVFFSGFIYFLFMAAWLNIFLIIGQLAIITSIAAITALTVAILNIKDFFFFKKGISLVIPEKAKPDLFERMRGLLKARSLYAMATGAVVLAITANAYELLCTAGFPMVYTRVLTLHKLTALQYYSYLVLYNIVYVIPLAFMVATVTLTLGAKKLTEWQGRKLKLISGLMMFFLGLILLIKPAILNNVIASIALITIALAISGIVIFLSKKFNPVLAQD